MTQQTQEPKTPSVTRSLRSMKSIQLQLASVPAGRRLVLRDDQRAELARLAEAARSALASGDVGGAVRALAGEGGNG